MTTMRVALYVYDKAEVEFAPSQSVELNEMTSDYTARPVTKIGEPTTLTLGPGVYGYWYEDDHGITAGRDVTLVTDLAVASKQPWPKPPPPPPHGFTARRDWDEHRSIFLVPLGIDLSATG